MKKYFCLLPLALLLCTTVNAKIRRVGFFASPIANTDYTTFALAYTAAASNDTILVFPNNAVSGTITKKLFIFGPGCWLDPNATPKGNANLQAFAGIATIGSLTFDVGSSGSVISGFNDGTVFIKESNITILRNREILVYIAFTNPAATVTNIQVLQNYKLNFQNYYANASSVTNMNISNNFMYYFSTATGNTYSGNISNNVWAYDQTQTTNNLNGGPGTISYYANIELGAGAYLLQNNIFVYYSNAAAASNGVYSFGNGGNSIFNYNLALQGSTATNWGVGTGNITTPTSNAANIFNAFPLIGTASADARYQLKGGSPALTVGAGNTPIGMFTGSYPYKLSGIPTIPTIYTLTSPQGNNPPGSTIQINVSTRGNN